MRVFQIEDAADAADAEMEMGVRARVGGMQDEAVLGYGMRWGGLGGGGRLGCCGDGWEDWEGGRV